MEKIILYCKSYRGDVQGVLRLKNSIEKFNKDNIPFYVSCPLSDKKIFEEVLGTKNYTLINDEDIFKLKSNLDGWRSQQIIKSNLHKTNITENYLAIDSDCYFIKDFYISDFMAKENVPYTIIHENKEASQYKKLFFGTDFDKGGYVEALNAYREIFDSPYKKLYDYGNAPYIWSCKVWEHFEKNYLIPNKMTFETFQITMEHQFQNIRLAMREAIVYGEYVLNTKVIELIPTGPYFKFYNSKEMVEYEKKVGLFDEEKLKSSYIGILYQSKI